MVFLRAMASVTLGVKGRGIGVAKSSQDFAYGISSKSTKTRAIFSDLYRSILVEFYLVLLRFLPLFDV